LAISLGSGTGGCLNVGGVKLVHGGALVGAFGGALVGAFGPYFAGIAFGPTSARISARIAEKSIARMTTLHAVGIPPRQGAESHCYCNT